jgi:predicted HAD superfamily Cof-like phosphohydrolase
MMTDKIKAYDWPDNMRKMHDKYGAHEVVEKFDSEKLTKFLEFRANFLQEELNELKTATNPDDVVDALIDLCVVAIGTLDLFKVDSHESWNRVWLSNLAKEVGVKASRPNKLGLPDLIKPEGWKAPTHADNVGLLAKVNLPLKA